MTEPLRIRIRSDWDAALTYDSLDEKAESRPVFVGRKRLIAPLVAEICEPNKRGTYLISGYRGTGKTTLLIEALSQAQDRLPPGHKLFPLVLNVSEVSASLGTATIEPKTGKRESDPTEPSAPTNAAAALQIDSRRLLVALLRTIAHRIGDIANKPEYANLGPLAAQASNAYEKATAAKFARIVTQAQETMLTHAREFALALEAKDILKTLVWVLGAAAAAFETAAWVGPRLGWLHGVAGSLLVAGLGVGISLAVSYKRSSSEKQSAANQTALEHDNSLQQLETDLKDILNELKKQGLRTVVVMEELDKIQDDAGSQLENVIRYFKNLFTQAPALFFFVTDKSYFDVIASAIKHARRARSYAVEHTFFTHRLFVGRATTEESLKFINDIVLDEEHAKTVTAVAQTLGKPGRIGEADQLGRFVRVVLFSAANHLFDLKNELRRFVVNEEEQQNGKRVSTLLIDDQSLPPERAAVAVFQDLIIEKTRSFEIKGGRTYANETLADCLYAVFNELGSNRPQTIASFLPLSNADPEKGLLLDEQLDLNEAARVGEAVNSLIADLERGRALTRDGDTFTWAKDAARAFRYVRQLEKHEESLVAELQRHVALVTPLAALLPPAAGLAQDLEKRLGEVREAREPMSADAAAEGVRGVSGRYAETLTAAFSEPLDELLQYGFVFEPVARGLAGSLYFVKPKSGDPRFSSISATGGVLLAFGETETLLDDVWSFMRPPESSPPLASLDRAALVHVIHATGSVAAEVESRREQWNLSLATRAGTNVDFRYAVDVIALVDPDRDPNLSCVQRIAAALAGFGAWSRPDKRAYEHLPIDLPTLESPLTEWMASDSPLFHVATPTGEKTRPFKERDALERDGRVVLSLGKQVGSVLAFVAAECMSKGFGQLKGGPELWTPLSRWLLSERRVLLYVDWQSPFSPSLENIVEIFNAGARVIVTNISSLPTELESFDHIRFPPLLAAGSGAPVSYK